MRFRTEWLLALGLGGCWNVDTPATTVAAVTAARTRVDPCRLSATAAYSAAGASIESSR